MPQTHRFEPTQFHIAIGAWDPALRIQSGDSVETWTVDSGGRDKDLNQRSPGGNPQTGPFYVEGAEPGDVLAVRFDRITPNRPQAHTSAYVSYSVVDPGFVPRFPRDRGRILWNVDVARGVATPEGPAALNGKFEVPIDPMLGCFGVAPDRNQAISCATSGPHGGNMDYNGFRQGVTVYLPVFVPGALFQLGDGHATQGDGEITGNGTEISMDVTFTAWVHRKKQPIGWPRAEDAEWLMAAGNARPLDQALQHATTELLKWLEEDYALDNSAASVMLGQTIKYDVGNVFDPAYTMVAKIRKSYLEPFRSK
jgi:acetamidase/formamidase